MQVGYSPGYDVVADLAGYRARATSDPRVALSRIVGAGDTAADVLARWRVYRACIAPVTSGFDLGA